MAATQRWRQLLFVLPYLFGLAVLALMYGYSPPAPDDRFMLRHAEMRTVGVDDWQTVGLPDIRVPDPGAQTWSADYRMTFRGPGANGVAATSPPWAVFLPSFTSRLAIRVNDVLVVDSQWHQTALSLNHNVPLIATIPAPVLKPDINRLDIILETAARARGYLGQVAVGPNDLLMPVYNQRAFIFSTVPQLAFAWAIAFALSMFILYNGRRQEWETLLFGLVLLGNSVSWLPLILPAQLDIAPDILRLTNFTYIPQALLMTPLAHSAARRPVPRWLVWTIILAIPGFVLAYFTLTPPALRLLNLYFLIPLSIGMFAWSLVLVVTGAIRRNDGAFHIMSAAALVLVGMAFHDATIAYGVTWWEPIFLTRFAVPLFLLSVAVVWIGRFAIALNKVDRFNIQLRQEIAAAEAALRDSFAREQVREKAMVVDAERSRLTRDLHDGLAGQLMSIVAMSQRGDHPPGDIGVAARHALTDLRLVIASMADVGDDLGMMLANFRDHITPQLRTMGVRLDWQMSVIPDMPGLTSSAALEIFRILQEATANAARHSGAKVVTVRIRPAPDGNGVRLEVADNGRGGAAPRDGGHGLATMQRRAEAVGGRLTVETNADVGGVVGGAAGGTKVVLDLPFAPVP